VICGLSLIVEASLCLEAAEIPQYPDNISSVGQGLVAVCWT